MPIPRQPLRFRASVGRAVLLALAVALVAAAPVLSQDQAAPTSDLPRGTVPSPELVLGHALGERFTGVAGVYRYMETLADASPRVEVREYGRSVEGRRLLQVVIGTPEHLAGLEGILDVNAELVDPGTRAVRAEEIVATNPAVVYLSYGVHGDESSPSEAAMWTAWDLARGVAEARGVLDSVVVVMDPVLNPDGRDRYVSWYRGVRSRSPDPAPTSWEHREPWPGGRYNHYLFDLNRDWAWMTQRETRARLATWSQWNPQVHVDFHEMGENSTYFFFPPTPPINPVYPEHVLDWGRRFGAANAAAFDRRGWLYFTGSAYDLFYPGYGDTWSSLLGAVGMTYEQAGGGAAGLVLEREDGSFLTLRDRAQHHRVAGLTTVRTAADGRTGLLEGFARIHRDVDEGLPDILLVPAGSSGALVDLLVDQGIRVERALEPFEAEAAAHAGYPARERFPAGTYRVRARQSRGRLAVALLRADNAVDVTDSYDITGWSLPYAYGVEAHSVEGSYGGSWEGMGGSAGPDGASGSPARTSGEAGAGVGYLVAPAFRVAPALVRFLAAGGRAVRLEEPFVLEGRSYPAGTFFLPRERNEDLEGLLDASSLERWAEPASTGRAASGPDLGTGRGRSSRLPRVALLGGPGTDPPSFGAHWYFLERTLGLPFDVVRPEEVADLPLESFDVVIAPSGPVTEELGDEGVGALSDWVARGGTLVAAGRSAEGLAAPVGGVEVRASSDEPDPAGEARLGRALATRTEREQERRSASMDGAVLPVRLDPGHPLTWGAGAGGDGERMFVLSLGRAFEPSADFESPAHFPEGVRPVSGDASPGVLERLSRGAWLVQAAAGEGTVEIYADDPLIRHFWHAGFQLFSNAVFLGGTR